MIIEKIAEITNINLDSKPSPRRNFTYRELLKALLDSENISEASRVLGISQNALEHLLSRNVTPRFPSKTKTRMWDNFLYGLVSLKKCSRCKCVKPFSEYSKDSSSTDMLNHSCKECKAIYRKQFSEANPEYSSNHYTNNKSSYIANAIKYKTQREIATPPWANLEVISRIYNCAEGDHVDHIIPLQGELVCGLHVENNLQYLSPHDNIVKSNKFSID